MNMKNKVLLLSVGFVSSLLLMQGNVFAQEIAVKDNAQEATPVDFPGRLSLKEEKEASLPSLSESVIKEPAPMERVVSKKEAPSEQLLGRITPEVFHEMADLERGNVFLELQQQREELKNKLEDLKSKYREARLAEIEKRENVIRTRVKWQQEQERIRQDILKKQLETEALEKKLEESEIEKEDLLPVSENEVDSTSNKGQAKSGVEEQNAFEIQKIIDIKGMKDRLIARVIDNTGKTLTLKVGSELPSGFVVKEITRTEIRIEKGDNIRILNIDDFIAMPETIKNEE